MQLCERTNVWTSAAVKREQVNETVSLCGPISNVITLKLFLDLGIWSSENNVHLLSVLLDVSVKNAYKPCRIMGCAREKNWQHWINDTLDLPLVLECAKKKALGEVP